MEHAAGAVKRAILVLGMHRTGTSALARVLSLRGAHLPAHLMSANAGNPTGYWEPQALVDLNDRILADHGVRWDDPFAYWQLPAADALAERYLEEAVRLVDAEYGDAPLLVMKDPRATLLAGFWQRVFEAAGYRCHVVVMGRAPGEVVDSLDRRDGTPPELARLLYTAYGIAALEAAGPGAPFVTYPALMADWAGETDRIAATLGFRWPRDANAVAGDVAGFLSPSRAAAPAGPPVPATPADAWADAVWSAMSARAADADAGAGLPADVASVSRAMSKANDEVGRALSAHVRHQVGALEERIAALEEGEVRLHGMFEASQAALRETAEARDRHLAERDRALAARDDAIGERDQARARAADAEAERDRAMSARDAAIGERDVARARTVDAEGERDRALAARDDAVGERETARERAELIAAARDEFERDRNHLLGLYHALEAAHARSEDARARYRAELDTMLGSRSWRLTRPLRAVADRLRRLRTPRVRPAMSAPGIVQPPVGVDAAAAEVPSRAVTPDGPGHAPAIAGDAPTLGAYLADAFGVATGQAQLEMIRGFALPWDARDVRGAAAAACDADEAVAWMGRIADLAITSRLDARTPEVSIVVPVYNQVRFTLACLEALARHRSRFAFEVLVGDDASTDATPDALAHAPPGIVHVRHAGNQGFVRNCNATAARARGRIVVFLNNDTVVLPGWLDELAGTLDADPGIGLAGSKLVFPDGRMQECGAIVWRDGSAWNFGRLDDPARPEYGYLRDVDYVSGASIALPRALWEQLDGFDTLFAPAYAEDADLAFRVRDAGLRTVVQPLSQLLHFEGITSGTDTGSGAKAYQVANLAKLRERWAHVLAGHRDNADRPDLEKERGVAKRVLFVDHVTPTPHADAGSVVAWEVMRIFQSLGYKVTFIPEDNFAHVGEDTRALQRVGIEAIYHPAYSRMADFLAARRDPFDVVFIHRFPVGESHMADLRAHFPAARVLFLNADMYHLRELRAATLAGDARAIEAAGETRRRELAVCSGADRTLVHSETEAALVAEHCPGADVSLFPLIVDPCADVRGLEGRAGACFIGGYRHPPNVDAIAWFVESVWPLVRDAVPGATLDIVGSHAPDAVRRLGDAPGVRFVGFVEDLGTYMADRRLSVAPLRYGAGAKGKIVSSLAHGLPVACTAIGAEGMGLRDGEEVLVGDDPEALAAHVVTLLRDDAAWRALSAAGLAWVGRTTSRERARERLAALLD